MSPYLLLGFLLAGLMHAFIPNSFYVRYLASNNIKSVINAAILGIPLPLCSCGVIPTAMSMRKEGASQGAVVSFMIATPQTGVDSIIATYGLLGLPFAIVRPLAAITTSILGGIATLPNSKQDSAEIQIRPTSTRDYTFAQKIRIALEYGFITMIQNIGKRLFIGLVIAAFISICIPSNWFIKDNVFFSILLVLCMSIPMYICATGSIPIAVALMMKGLTPGAALVLLMAGPACNLASILVVRKILGIRTLIIYLTSIILGSIIFGLCIDYMQFYDIVDFRSHMVLSDTCCVRPDSWFAWSCSIILFILLINSIFHKKKNININTISMKTYHIEGMNCNHCRMAAEKAILGVNGVTKAVVDLQKKEAYVEGTAVAEDIIKAVEEVGFSCTE